MSCLAASREQASQKQARELVARGFAGLKMNELVYGNGVGFRGLVACFLTVCAAGCSASEQQPGSAPSSSSAGVPGGGNATGGSGMATSGTAGTATAPAGGTTSTSAAGSDGSAQTTGGAAAGSASTTGGTATGGGSMGGAAASGGTSPGGGATTTVELIGPGGATCGATNATHGDGFVCVLSYPNAGANVIGYWFDYAFSANTCDVSFTKPAGNNAANPQVCFSGKACAATSGGGLGLALCDVHGIDVSTWPELMMLESTSSLSPTAKSPFHGCNPSAVLTSVSWTLGGGSIPAGTSVLFDDAADVSVARVDNLAAGATSVAVPANVDASKIASIKFSVSGASSTAWNFCLTSLKLSMR